MPEWMCSGYDVDQLVQGHLAGQPNAQFFDTLSAGSPQYQSDNPVAVAMQDVLNAGYKGKAWTPSQVKELGREPQPYEFSPGGRHLDQLTQREKLYQALMEEAKPESTRGWQEVGGGDPYANANSNSLQDVAYRKDSAAKEYGARVGRTHAYTPGTGPGTYLPGFPDEGMSAFFNPENSIGTLTTKMGPVLSDAASQIGTASFVVIRESVQGWPVTGLTCLRSSLAR